MLVSPSPSKAENLERKKWQRKRALERREEDKENDRLVWGNSNSCGGFITQTEPSALTVGPTESGSSGTGAGFFAGGSDLGGNRLGVSTDQL